ncbi:hypothetical protein [Cyanothece sp. BG0011]|uniref:hypothetical protein n=1 Tax=Cyanothece sp. BG0011 TaxID=2082950 RepID=UPI000D1FC3AD|nr:hypothetical protein [Cyanothece sp. BG0011]
MKITQSIHDQVKRMLNQPSNIDGRMWVSLSFLSYFGFLFVANFFVSYQEVWKKLKVPAMNPSFADLRAILTGFECTRLGFDVLLENPCDPWDRPVIYPRIWWKLTGLGLDESHTVMIGILLGIIFFFITFMMIGRLNLYEGIIYSLILCSPPVMLLIERGNLDLIIYAMVFLTLQMAQSQQRWVRILGYIGLLIPTALKIFSFFSLTIILKETRKIFILYFLPLFTLSAIYIYSIKSEISVAQNYRDIFTWYSFGYEILLNKLSLIFSLSWILTRKLHLFAIFGLILALAGFAFFIFRKVVPTVFKDIMNTNSLKKQNFLPSKTILPDSRALDAFRIGSSIYLGLFLSTISFDYKLAFLIFAIPQIIQWIKQDSPQLAIPSSFGLLGILATFYLSPLAHQFLIDELVNWLLWLYFLYGFLLTLPNWMKLSINRLIPEKMLV